MYISFDLGLSLSHTEKNLLCLQNVNTLISKDNQSLQLLKVLSDVHSLSDEYLVLALYIIYYPDN